MIDLRMVSLTPLYADPAKTTTDFDLNLHPFGYRGPQDLLNFPRYKGKRYFSGVLLLIGPVTIERWQKLTLIELYLFQEAITGYLAAVDLLVHNYSCSSRIIGY